MEKLRTVCCCIGAISLGSAFVLAAAPATSRPGTRETVNVAASVKTLLAEENNALDRDIASRMLRRVDLPPERRAKLELEIDLRIIERALIATAEDAKFPGNDQAVAWLRARQFRQAVRGLDNALTQDPGIAAPSQKDALTQIHKLSFAVADLKPGKELDDFCRAAAISMANVVSATPVSSNAMVIMRPKPITEPNDKDHPPTVAELTEQVQRLAAISVSLRQQLIALAQAAASAQNDQASGLYNVLSQSIDLARGLQSNTAVSPEARTTIESQLAEGIVLFSDPRTRDAGKSRIDALGQYRQTLARVGKMGLSRDQMEQLAPALAWAQANPEAGAKLMGMIEQYLDFGGKWDALPKDPPLPQTLRRPLEDLKSQFAKHRTLFIQQAARITGISAADLETEIEELKRLYTVTEDLQAMSPSLDTLNAYKVKPIGGLERKVTTAAIAAANPTPSTNRNDAQKYLHSVHQLAVLSKSLNNHHPSDLPPTILQQWANKYDPFETRCKGLVAEMAGDLIGGALELDKGKLARLETAQAISDTLRTAAQLEAALSKSASLSRWADWAIDAATLQGVLSNYRDATAAAVFGYASDNLDAVDKWRHLRTRYEPLIALILKDSAYAQQCDALPIGFSADLTRLATPFESAPFATERFTSASIGVWTALERAGDSENAERVSIDLAKRLARDLRLQLRVDETLVHPVDKFKN